MTMLASVGQISEFVVRWIAIGVGIVLTGIVILVVLRLLAGRKQTTVHQLVIEKIDLRELEDSGPPKSGPRLEFYHIPVRLCLLVLAPVGREGTLPEKQDMPELIDQLIPGLMKILRSHQPVYKVWPAQLSSDGFLKTFFHHAALPGDHGKGTPWCSLAGKFESEGRLYLVGMICRADARNNLGKFEVEHVGKWLDVLRVRAD